MPLPIIDFEAAIEQIQCIGKQHPQYQSSSICPEYYLTPTHRDLDLSAFIHLKNGKHIHVWHCKTEAEMIEGLQTEMDKALAKLGESVAA